MATLKDFYSTDFSRNVTSDQQLKNSADNSIQDAKIIYEIISNTHVIIYYLVKSPDYFENVKSLITQFNIALESTDGIICLGGFVGDIQAGASINPFSRTIYIYSENDFQADEIKALRKIGNKLNLVIIIWGSDYVKNKAALEKPVAFISHDSRDKSRLLLK